MKMGDAHCCTIAGSAGVFNNQKATEWYCKAAQQNEPRAFYELGRIYSGDLVRGLNGPGQGGGTADGAAREQAAGADVVQPRGAGGP